MQLLKILLNHRVYFCQINFAETAETDSISFTRFHVFHRFSETAAHFYHDSRWFFQRKACCFALSAFGD